MTVIRRLESPAEAEACARIMSSTDPWITLGRGYDASLEIIQDPTREVYVAGDEGGVTGFVILNMGGAFVGYIQTVAVREDVRSTGLGSRLIAFAEDRIFRKSPNVFMCVSGFNTRAKHLYERLGYTVVGVLDNYVVTGYSEWLLRKTRGPIIGFERKET